MPDAVPSRITVSARARELLADALREDGRARYVRVRVGRGWAGLTVRLSLDETASSDDEVLESGGIPFAVARHLLHLVSGVKVEVEEFMGREGIVVHHPLAGGC